MPLDAAHTETEAERRARHAAVHAELAALNLAAARLAAARLAAAADDAAASAATLDLARATRATEAALAAEERAANGEPPPRAPAGDPRRELLREPLYAALAAEPDPVRRTRVRRRLDERIEDRLALDPDADCPLAEHVLTLAREFAITLDLAELRDELIFLPPRPTLGGPGDRPDPVPD